MYDYCVVASCGVCDYGVVRHLMCEKNLGEMKMKTVNGNNKLERQINKAKKYLGVDLVEKSNKFLKVMGVDCENETYIVKYDSCVNNFKLVKNGELYVVCPLNWKSEKPIFIKSYFAIEDDNYFNGKYLIFKSYSDELKELAKGCDDVWLVNEYIKNHDLFVSKK